MKLNYYIQKMEIIFDFDKSKQLEKVHLKIPFLSRLKIILFKDIRIGIPGTLARRIAENYSIPPDHPILSKLGETENTLRLAEAYLISDAVDCENRKQYDYGKTRRAMAAKLKKIRENLK